MNSRWMNRFTLVLFCLALVVGMLTIFIDREPLRAVPLIVLAIVAIVMVTCQMRQERDREAKSEHGDV